MIGSVNLVDGDGLFASSGTITHRNQGGLSLPGCGSPPAHHRERNTMKKRRPPYFRNSLDTSSKVQVKVLRRCLKLSNVESAAIVRKIGNSIAAISKEAAKT
jgi:hypothetical protein